MAEIPHVLDVTSVVVIVGHDDEIAAALDRHRDPAWREQAYDLPTRLAVLEHWARAVIIAGVRDVSRLDGWADVPPGRITFHIDDARLGP